MKGLDQDFCKLFVTLDHFVRSLYRDTSCKDIARSILSSKGKRKGEHATLGDFRR